MKEAKKILKSTLSKKMKTSLKKIYEDAQDKNIVEDLLVSIDNCIRELGDKSLNITGTEVRPAARIENPKTLTTYEKNHPYMYAEYDKGERG